ncbi:short chain dehydrogenase [Allobacillus halotolerans]|uniref:Short chain dehydrogenase n=1 Tax=Allobacillus halotolerans TaxID=570278 RepID=A0ABS6GSU5_9BACI|nr:short chain dehydrogenase [Allobacillus halotolerans]MBU6081744.1 short chain dehydrogenase [Allobacillus halotolerans]
MKILLIGATGLLGQAVKQELEGEHEIIGAALEGADFNVDMTKPDQIREMFEKIGKVDAVISTAGDAPFVPLEELTPELNDVGIESKLKGQINLVLIGMDYVNDGGSFTLTTGILMDDPIPKGTSSAMTNGAITGFVKSAAIELPRGIRINNVSPNVFSEASKEHRDTFQGFEPVSIEKVALAFRKSVNGKQTGQTYKVY